MCATEVLRDFESPECENDIRKLIQDYQSKYKIIGCGRNRLVFADRDWVLKVPCNTAGMFDNEHEYQVYKRSQQLEHISGEIRYARCRMCGPYVLVMEQLDTSIDRESFPSWASWVDCGQVGLDRQGRFAAYDYGIF